MKNTSKEDAQACRISRCTDRYKMRSNPGQDMDSRCECCERVLMLVLKEALIIALTHETNLATRAPMTV